MGKLEKVDPKKNPVEYISTGGPKSYDYDNDAEQMAASVPKPDHEAMQGAMVRRLTQFFSR